MKHVILTGYMGCGKSTIGKKLAQALDYEYLDTDEWIEDQQQCTITEIFARYGETYFRALESKLLIALAEKEEPVVLSTGGGMPCQEGNAERLRDLGTVYYLNTSTNELVKRLTGDTSRPLIQGEDLKAKVEGMLKIRDPLYREAAHEVIDTDGLAIEQIITMIQEKERRSK